MNKLELPAAECIADLLKYWKNIELWIKKAEQVNKRAVIPAINELRYASRQLINAIYILDQGSDTDNSRRKIRRHLTLAEQYLINADHDIADSITSFLNRIVEDVDVQVGDSIMVSYFPSYKQYTSLLSQSDDLIAQAREDYSKRREIYEKLRSQIIPDLINNYRLFRNAEVLGRHQLDKARIDSKRFTKAARIEKWVTMTSSIMTILAFIVLISTFKYSTSGYCMAHPNGTGFLSFLCD